MLFGHLWLEASVDNADKLLKKKARDLWTDLMDGKTDPLQRSQPYHIFLLEILNTRMASPIKKRYFLYPM